MMNLKKADCGGYIAYWRIRCSGKGRNGAAPRRLVNQSQARLIGAFESRWKKAAYVVSGVGTRGHGEPMGEAR